MGRPDYIFFVNSEKPRDAAMRNTGTGFAMLSHVAPQLVFISIDFYRAMHFSANARS